MPQVIEQEVGTLTVIKKLIDDAIGMGVFLYIDEGKLKYVAKKDSLTEELRDDLKKYRAELISYLTILNSYKDVEGIQQGVIQPVDRNSSTDLVASYAQQRLWFLDSYIESNAVYNVFLALRLRGDVNTEALIGSLKEIVFRHEVLRTRFGLRENKVVQIIDEPALDLDVETVSTSEQLKGAYQSERFHLFDLSKDRLCRMRLIRDLSDSTGASYVLLVVAHHSVIDGWSLGIFSRELFTLYEAFLKGNPSPLSPLPIQYADYASWQRRWLSGKVLEEQLAYWKAQLDGIPTLLTLPTDRPRPLKQTFVGSTEPVVITSDISHKLQVLTRTHDVTLFTTLLSAFAVLLSRYSGQEDVVIGVPIANRTRRETEDLIGFFINTLVMRCDISENPKYSELLRRTHSTALQGYAHQDIPFEHLVEALNPDRSMSHSPLFQVMFTLQNMSNESASIEGVELSQLIFSHEDAHDEGERSSSKVDLEAGKGYEVGDGVAKFDLTLSLQESDQGLVGSMEYNTDLFDRATIRRLSEHYVNLLEVFVHSPHVSVSDATFLSEAERRQQLLTWNNTNFDYPKDSCIHELFEAAADLYSDTIAVTSEEHHLSYSALNHHSNQLAHYLQSLGVGPEVGVGIYVDRSLDVIVSILAILKAGGYYVPLDTEYPQQRIQHLLEDSGLEFLITHSSVKTVLDFSEMSGGNGQVRYIYLDGDWNVTPHRGDKPIVSLLPSNLAYVIYTSGSTGQPKGVPIHHNGLTNLACALLRGNGFNENSHILQFASLAFDAAVIEIFTALISGATLHILSESDRKSPPELSNFVERRQITHVFLPPALLANLQQESFRSTSTMIVAGEAVGAELAYQWAENRTFYNAYGPTEVTVGATCGQYVGGTAHIGRPFANIRCYVLDGVGNLVPTGVVGELYIDSVGLSRGYQGKAGLTAERFIPNPYSEVPGRRMYRTGDLVHYLPDGNIEFVGRIDHQVKIRGFRIELGEIENVLLLHEQVKDALVLAHSNERADKILVAYVAVEVQEAAETDGLSSVLRAYVQKHLPGHMVPSVIMTLDALPLTIGGKVDRRALPAPDTLQQREKYVAPEGETEILLARLWGDALGQDKVSRYDNFFELGGHSLLVPQVLIAIQMELQLELQFIILFENPVLADFAVEIDRIREDDSPVGNTIRKEPVLNVDDDLSSLHIDVDGLGDVNLETNHILLTGATGFVGNFLLSELMCMTQSRITCLVREENDELALDRLLQTSNYYKQIDNVDRTRIEVLAGDLTKNNFGLELNKYCELAENVDAVYHCAASVNHFANYEQLKPANVHGTARLLTFSATNKLKKFNFISTENVLANSSNSEVVTLDEDVDIAEMNHLASNGYGSTKWAAERMVMKAREAGVPAKIFRIGLVCGDSKNGIMSDKLWIYYYIKSCLCIGCYLNHPIGNSLIPVDILARMIILLGEKGESESNVFHLFESEKIGVNDFFDIYNKVAERKQIKVSESIWMEEAEKYSNKHGMELPILLYASGLFIRQTDLPDDDEPLQNEIIKSNAKTLELLRKQDIEWPVLSTEYAKIHMNSILNEESTILWCDTR